MKRRAILVVLHKKTQVPIRHNNDTDGFDAAVLDHFRELQDSKHCITVYVVPYFQRMFRLQWVGYVGLRGIRTFEVFTLFRLVEEVERSEMTWPKF